MTRNLKRGLDQEPRLQVLRPMGMNRDQEKPAEDQKHLYEDEEEESASHEVMKEAQS